jgi:integrase
VRAAGASAYSDAVARCQASEPTWQEEQEQAEEPAPKARVRRPRIAPDGDQPPRRQYLTEREVEQLCDAARKRGRYGSRDALMVLMAYRHGLRVSELMALRWADVDLVDTF